MARQHRVSTFRRGLVAGAFILLAACQTTSPDAALPEPAVSVDVEPGWRRAARPEDVDRIDRLDEAWDVAIRSAEAAGHRRTMAREGALLDPSAALAMPAPPPGAYTCRLLRFGPERRRGPVLTVYRSFFCNVGVDGEALTLIKQTGSERPAGHLWVDDSPDRLIFIGTLSRGADEDPLAYGDDSERDMVATFERIEAFRFRLVVPWPRAGAVLDFYELVPSPVQYQE